MASLVKCHLRKEESHLMLQSHRSLFRSSLSWRNLAKGEMAGMIKSVVVLIKIMVVVLVINMIVVVVVNNMMVVLIKVMVVVTNLSREEMAEGREDKRLCWMLNTWSGSLSLRRHTAKS